MPSGTAGLVGGYRGCMSQSTPNPSPAEPTGPTGQTGPSGPTGSADPAASPPGRRGRDTSTPEPAETRPAPTRGQEKDPLRGSRTGGIYAALIAFGLVLILLIIFIAQNTESVPVRFLGWEGSAPLAVSLLIAVAAGLLLAGAAASARIVQLRRRVKKERKHA